MAVPPFFHSVISANTNSPGLDKGGVLHSGPPHLKLEAVCGLRSPSAQDRAARSTHSSAKTCFLLSKVVIILVFPFRPQNYRRYTIFIACHPLSGHKLASSISHNSHLSCVEKLTSSSIFTLTSYRFSLSIPPPTPKSTCPHPSSFS